MKSGGPLLELAELGIEVDRRQAPAPVVEEVSLSVRAAGSVGLVGESGAGKTLTALAIMRLLPAGARVFRGSVQVNGTNLLELDEVQMRRIRGAQVAMTFQDPSTALNPLLKVIDQVSELPRTRGGLSGQKARLYALQLLEEVGLADPDRWGDTYPHQLSGGMRQRVLMASALSGDPQLLIADEPTASLDVTLQIQLLDLLRRRQRDRGMGLLLISHDLRAVARVCEEIAVMYAGRVVERAPAATFFKGPAHPYAAALLRCAPTLHRISAEGGRLPTIPAQKVDGTSSVGCQFRTRCDRATALCAQQLPGPSATESGGIVFCHHPLRPG